MENTNYKNENIERKNYAKESMFAIYRIER